MSNEYKNKGQKPYEPCHEVDSTIMKKEESREANKRYYRLGIIDIKCKEPQTTFDGEKLTTAELRKKRKKI